ncbi:hypothetical protein [Streptosporangium sp. KLBMP 9127]|nr:hypothetical protein [Streptosporangium sp. KLBMP 9127]
MTVAVLLVLGLVAAWSVLIPGVDAWENIMVAVIGSLRLTGPVAAAFACWVALRKRRASAGRAFTTWQAMKVPLAIMVVTVAAFAATALLLAANSMLNEQAGRLAPSGLAMGMAGLALYVAIGWVAGWLLPWIGTPVLAGLGCYALFSRLADGGAWADRLAPATREPYDVFQGLSASAFTDQTLWLVGVSGALLLGWAALVTRQALVLAAAMLAVLAAATGLARLVSEPQTVSAQPVVYSCQEWPITICVHPGMRSGLTDLGAAFTKIASRLSGTPAEFTRVEQHPRRTGSGQGPGVATVHVDDLAAGFADEAAAEFLDGLAAKCRGARGSGYRGIVMAWLRGESLPVGPLPEHQFAAAWFSSLTEAQRRDWLRLFYSDFARCALRAEHFGGGPQVHADSPHGGPAPEQSAPSVPVVPQPIPPTAPAEPSPAPEPEPVEPTPLPEEPAPKPAEPTAEPQAPPEEPPQRAGEPQHPRDYRHSSPSRQDRHDDGGTPENR